MACLTSAFICSSWAAVGWTSSSPRTFTRIVPAPTKEATLSAMPRLARASSPSSSVDQVTGYLMSCSRCSSSLAIRGVSGPMEEPSPITSRVTPWRSSDWPRPSAMRLSSEWESMLMKPGATALPWASISRLPRPGAWGPT